MPRLSRTKNLLLVILDGWGHSEEKEHNAIARANTPNFDRLVSEFPNRLIEASQEAVGLPKEQMGNSEVGHLTLGAGRVIYQPLVRINNSIEDGSFYDNEEFLGGIENVKNNDTTLHLMGLFSSGGVHSHRDHLYALIRMALASNVKRTRLHLITDGRDVPPNASAEDVAELLDHLAKVDPKSTVRIATIMGRFYAMDRDRRWDRTQQAMCYYTVPMGNRTDDPVGYIRSSYEREVTDEFLEPVQVNDAGGDPLGTVSDGDTLIFFNFRPDRARQMTKAFVYPFFGGFVRPKVVRPYFVAMTDYDETVHTHVGFTEGSVTMGVGETVSNARMRQLRIAETEKYAHVTFFFSGGREDPYPGESRVLIPSPNVKTYDLRPEMSAYQLADSIVSQLEKRAFDFGILNFANSDMVGHTGIMEAAVEAVEAVDRCIGKVRDAGLDNGYHLIFTADHGNSEKMWDELKGIPFTAHTTNPVPFIYAAQGLGGDIQLLDGPANLSDVGPTILRMMEVTTPPQMTGRCLLPVE